MAEVAGRYADGFRSGAVDEALGVLDPEIVRVAPLETDGLEVEVRGLGAVRANAERQNEDIRLDAVEVGDPLVGETSFALRFSFEQTRRSTGRRQTTTKLSLCTVEASRITREEVHYYTPTGA